MNEQSDSSRCSAAVHCMESSNDVLTTIYDKSGNAFTHDGLCMYINNLVRENQRLRKKVAEVHYDSDRYREERDAAQHFIIETGAIPGIDCECRCDQCVSVAQGMERAGYLANYKCKWWDS